MLQLQKHVRESKTKQMPKIRTHSLWQVFAGLKDFKSASLIRRCSEVASGEVSQKNDGYRSTINGDINAMAFYGIRHFQELS